MGKLLQVLLLVNCHQNTLSTNAANSSLEMEKGEHVEHFLVNHGAWQSMFVFSVIGITSNSFLIHAFWTEQTVVTSVNGMVIMETLYRLGYNILTLWRTYNMVIETSLFNFMINREKVAVHFFFNVISLEQKYQLY